MKFKTFAAFVGPSVFMMVLFIAAPLVSVFIQSFQVTQPIMERVEVETCTPGFLTQTCTTETKTVPVLDADGKTMTETRWVGLQSYQNVLQMDKFWDAVSRGSWNDIMQIDFWRALRFTLSFTLLTLPLVIGVGLAIALAVNNAARAIRGPHHLRLAAALHHHAGDRLLVDLLAFCRRRHPDRHARTLDRPEHLDVRAGLDDRTADVFLPCLACGPFAFVIFYAGLQTVNMDTLESAVIDGANRWERLRHVVIPHLMPLIIFIALIHLMDCYRVFEEIVGFRSQAHVISLQWLTYDFMTPDDAGNRAISRASASAMLTMIGIVVLLILPLRRTWRDHKGSAH